MAEGKAALRALPKKQRRVVARQLAREQREAEIKRRHRRKIARRWAVAAGGVGVLVIAGLVVQAQVKATNRGPANMLSDGVVLGGDGTTVSAATTTALAQGDTPVATVSLESSGILPVVVYLDYASADASTFWTTNQEMINTWVSGGGATLEIHPLALSGAYSVRAAAAMGCVADSSPDATLAFSTALLAAQPDLDADGLSSAELVDLATGAGITDDAVASCITNGQFTGWATEATTRAAASVPFDVGTVTTSPVVLLAGAAYTGAVDDTTAFTTALTDAWSGLAANASTDTSTDTSTDGTTDTSTAAPTDTSTPTPTDTATAATGG